MATRNAIFQERKQAQISCNLSIQNQIEILRLNGTPVRRGIINHHLKGGLDLRPGGKGVLEPNGQSRDLALQ